MNICISNSLDLDLIAHFLYSEANFINSQQGVNLQMYKA